MDEIMKQISNKNIILNSESLGILAKYGFSPKDVKDRSYSENSDFYKRKPIDIVKESRITGELITREQDDKRTEYIKNLKLP